MIRVLHVIESLAAGGIETTFLNVLRAWHAAPAWASHEVLAFGGGVLAQGYRDVTAALHVAAAPDAVEPIVTGGYDVVHFTFDRCAVRWLPVVVARSRAAVVYGKGYDMGGMFRVGGGFPWQADESLLWGADAVTFTTEPLAAAFHAPAARTTVLGKAALVRRFAALPPPDAATPPRIVCVANLHTRKRLGDLVAAVAAVRADLPDACVRFVGADTTGEGERLRAQAAALGIEAACEVAGRRDDVATDLAEARVFALPSGCEGVPTAMLEAMAAARPVVVTDVGHVASVVTDGVEGYVVPAGDVAALTSRLRTLLLDPRRADAMGRAARVRAFAHDVGVVAGRLAGVLRGAAAGRAA